MRNFRVDKRGISPIVATILLIAITVIAAGVIAAWASGLYVGSTTIKAGTADGTVYDYDSAAAGENYKNANVTLTVKLTSGRLRNIGDSSYPTVIDLTNPTTGFHASLSFSGPTYTGDWGGTVEYSDNVDAGLGTSDNKVTITVRIPTDSKGRMVAGSTMTILMYPKDVTSVRDNSASHRGTNVQWEDKDTINIIISGRDSLSLTGYDGAYLMGRSWAE